MSAAEQQAPGPWRRAFAKHEGPEFCGPCYAIRSIEKFRSQWRIVDRAYNSAPYHWDGADYPADTLQVTVVVGTCKTKQLAIARATPTPWWPGNRPRAAIARAQGEQA